MDDPLESETSCPITTTGAGEFPWRLTLTIKASLGKGRHLVAGCSSRWAKRVPGANSNSLPSLQWQGHIFSNPRVPKPGSERENTGPSEGMKYCPFTGLLSDSFHLSPSLQLAVVLSIYSESLLSLSLPQIFRNIQKQQPPWRHSYLQWNIR